MSALRIAIATPAATGTRLGNRVTAERWAEHLQALGASVAIVGPEDPAPLPGEFDLLVALHALRSAERLREWKEHDPAAPAVLMLTGTDLYRDLDEPGAQASLARADRIVGLHSLVARRLPEAVHAKVRVIEQSQSRVERRAPAEGAPVELVCVGHMRAEKDPMAGARALARLPERAELRLTQIGSALEPEFERDARAFEARDPRYRWLGDRPRDEVMQRLARASYALCTSFMEGGANSVVEALACGVPLFVSAIDGNLGLLGEDYPGQYPPGDDAALAALIARALEDSEFRSALEVRLEERRPLVRPERERDSLARLLKEFTGP